jgi:hypothetical protein
MKSIYEFTVNKKVKKQVEEQTDAGKLVKEVEQDAPIKIIFKKPNRAESEEADSVSAVEYSDSIRKGIITKPLLEKLYDEKGGFLAENYEKKSGQLLSRFWELENKFQTLNIKENKTADDQEELNQIAGEFVQVRNNLQALESQRNTLFQNTAETRAQNKTVFWLTLFLTYIQEDPNQPATPFYDGVTFEEKRADYDKKVETDDSFVLAVIDRMAFFAALWFFGRASTKEDFQRIEDTLNPAVEAPEPEKQEKPEESPAPVDTPV